LAAPEINKNLINKPGNSLYQFLYSPWPGNSALLPFFLLVNIIRYYVPANERNLYRSQLKTALGMLFLPKVW
jgi:hypothetical protein